MADPEDNVSRHRGDVEEETASTTSNDGANISNEGADRASTEQIHANTRLIDENIKSIAFKRNFGIGVSFFAMFIHFWILYGAYKIVFCECRTDPVMMVSISAAVLSFVAIYGIIISSALRSSPQNNVDNSNTSARGALDIVHRLSSNQ